MEQLFHIWITTVSYYVFSCSIKSCCQPAVLSSERHRNEYHDGQVLTYPNNGIYCRLFRMKITIFATSYVLALLYEGRQFESEY